MSAMAKATAVCWVVPVGRVRAVRGSCCAERAHGPGTATADAASRGPLQ